MAPELVVTDASTTMKQVRYGEIQWLLLAAVQKLIAKVSALADTIASFADHFMTKELVATNGTFDQISAKKLCVEDVCVTRGQFLAMVAVAGQSGTSATWTQSSDAASSTTPPIIQINGNNPAHIQVGASYNDLGAVITGPTDADKDLGIHLYLDGVAVSSIMLDTSASSTHAIDYVATDTAGTATSTRTIFVEGAQYPTNEQATSTPQTSSGTASSTPQTGENASSTQPVS